MNLTNLISINNRKRISKLLLVTALSSCSLWGYAQQQQVRLTGNNVTLKTAFKQIEQQTKLSVDYNTLEVNDSRLISKLPKGSTVKEVMEQLLEGTGCSVAFSNRHIIITKQAQTTSDTKKITGTIKDENGEPIIGANVSVKGTTTGTITDINGHFSLEASASSSILVSYIGYKPIEVKVGNTAQLNISLKEDSQALDEVVVVGYGTQKKVTLTGAVSAVDSETLTTTKTGNIQNALSGKIAGLKNWQKSSEPGTFSNDFSIRGMGSPLVIVDGVPRDNFTRLDANEIESVSVLKDASASIYGVRAANGVVLVTTKKGTRDSKFQLDYTGYYGIQRSLKPERPLNALEYMELKNERQLNLGVKSLMFPKESFEPYWNGTKQSTDWTQELKENVPQTYHSISARGGTEKLDYYVGFGYNKENGLWKSGDLNYNRYNLRSNVTATIVKGLKVEALLNLMTDEKNSPYLSSDGVILAMYRQLPLNPYYANDNPDYPATIISNHPEVASYSDKSGYRKEQQRLAQTNLAVEWELPWVKGLKLRGMYSYDFTSNANKSFQKKYNTYNYDSATDTYIPVAVNSPSNVRKENYEYINSLLQLSVTYNKSFGDGHNLSGLFLYEESDRKGDNFWGSRDVSMDSLDHLFAGSSNNQQTNTNANADKLYHLAYKAIIGRVNYDYQSKYLAEFSFRYDGSSKNAPNKRWGFFPSGQIGWRLSEESFIKENEPLKFISNFKIRASYGLLGDDSATNNYQFLTGYNYPSGGYLFGTDYTNAIASRGMSNPYISWYKSTIADLGVDLDLWNGLLGITTDFYRRNRSGLLATRAASLPGLVGANLPQENLNSDMTQGWELTVSHKNKIGDFQYAVSGNMSLSRSKDKYVERAMANNSYDNWRNNTNDRWKGIWWGLDYLGQFQSYNDIYNYGVIYEYDSQVNTRILPGDLKYEDWNGDGLINDDDLHPITMNNEGDPVLNYGFNLSAQYKGFDIDLQFEGVGMRHLRYSRFYQDQFLWDGNGLSLYMDRWHRKDQFDPNCDEWVPGKYPSVWDSRGNFVATTNSGDPGPASSFWILNGSYLRLKSLDFGYTIPHNLSKVVGIQRARLFFNAYNLFTISAVKLVDPAHPTSGDGLAYPVTKTFNFGVNVTF